MSETYTDPVADTIDQAYGPDNDLLFHRDPTPVAATFIEALAIKKFGPKMVNRLKRNGITFVALQPIVYESGEAEDGYIKQDNGAAKLLTTLEVIAAVTRCIH